MKLIESLKRHLAETEEAIGRPRYKWLVATYAMVVCVSALHVFEPEYWQARRVNQHVKSIRPRWEAFKHQNPGFESVELFTSYDEAYGVRFGAKGTVPWTQDLNTLTAFMNGTRPPCPVDISKITTASQPAGSPPQQDKC